MASESNTSIDRAKCYILKCPPELILMFSEALGDDVHSSLSFRASCQSVNAFIEEYIYRHNIRNKQAYCMVWAATNGQLIMMLKAVALGANLSREYENVFDTRPAPPRYRVYFPLLHFALANGHADVATYLVEQGVDVDEDVGGAFARHVDFEWPKAPSNLPADSSFGFRGDNFGWGYTPLQIAIGKGDLPVAQLLIARGALGPKPRYSWYRLRAHVAIRRAALLGHHQLIPSIAASVPPAELRAMVRSLKKTQFTRPGLDPLRETVRDFVVPSDGSIETACALLELSVVDDCFDCDLWIDRAVDTGDWKLALALVQPPPPARGQEGNGCAHLNWQGWVGQSARPKQIWATLMRILARLEEGSLPFPAETWRDGLAVVKALVAAHHEAQGTDQAPPTQGTRPPVGSLAWREEMEEEAFRRDMYD